MPTRCRANSGSDRNLGEGWVGREASDMILRIAKERVERVHALEVETDVVLVSDADAAVQLQRLLGDPDATGRELNLRRRNVCAANGGVVLVRANHRGH